MLFVNLFADGGALVETVPQGETSVPLNLPEETAAALAALLKCDRVSAALARLFLAGVTAGERSVRRGAPS
jgi:hypothetical protein